MKNPGLEAARRAIAERGPTKAAERLNPIEKAKRNPKSLRLAINAKCFDCEGQDADPRVQWRIGNCVIPDCPLWPVRPYQSLAGTPTPTWLRDSEDQNGESS